MIDIEQVKQWAIDHWTLGKLHGISHWERVDNCGNPTIDACFDADRLDLGRVGITPDPNKMATAKGKELASRL